MRLVKHISYSELRCFSEKVMSFVRNETLVDNISLSTKIESDCRIAGDDIDDLISRFSAKFGVDFSEFEFGEHFYSEGEGAQFFPISILIGFIELVFELILLLFRGRSSTKNINQFTLSTLIDIVYGKGRKDLMVKDLVTCAIFGTFQLKEDTSFVLID